MTISTEIQQWFLHTVNNKEMALFVLVFGSTNQNPVRVKSLVPLPHIYAKCVAKLQNTHIHIEGSTRVLK